MTNFERYTNLLLTLHDLMAIGLGDSDEADKLRDSMDGCEAGNLTPQERELLEDLSGDLYQIHGEGAFAKVPDEMKPAKRDELRNLIANKNWLEALKLLRFSLGLQNWEVAFYRGKVWENFDPKIAHCFYKYADRYPNKIP
jgi:hypothetical protein